MMGRRVMLLVCSVRSSYAICSAPAAVLRRAVPRSAAGVEGGEDREEVLDVDPTAAVRVRGELALVALAADVADHARGGVAVDVRAIDRVGEVDGVPVLVLQHHAAAPRRAAARVAQPLRRCGA